MLCAQQRSSVRALAQWAPMEAKSCRAVALAGMDLTALVVTLVTAAVEAGKLRETAAATRVSLGRGDMK